MIRPMNFQIPTDEDIHTAFEKGELAVMDLFYDVVRQMSELAQQLAKQGEALQALQARLAKDSRNSSKPPSSDGVSPSPLLPPAAAARSKAQRGNARSGHAAQDGLGGVLGV